MQYAIKAVPNEPPFITSLSFIVHDYQQWGHDVTSYPDDSEYIKEIRSRKLDTTRLSLMQVWARDMIKCGYHRPVPTELSGEELRFERVSNMLKDFLEPIGTLGQATRPKTFKWWVPKFLKKNRVSDPNEPGLDLVTRYLSFLRAIRYTRNVRGGLLPGSPPTMVTADRIVLGFRPYGTPTWEQVAAALNEVGSRPGQSTTGPVRSMMTGVIRIELWVDVSDCVPLRRGEEDVVDPLPRYEVGDDLPGYENKQGE